jgi:hypothetical protein
LGDIGNAVVFPGIPYYTEQLINLIFQKQSSLEMFHFKKVSNPQIALFLFICFSLFCFFYHLGVNFGSGKGKLETG